VSDTKSAVYAGLQVLDLTNGIAGPMVTMLLADNGATVTRLVRPGSDPDALSGTGARVWNRSKRTIELDISTAAGRAELDRLAADADIVVDSLSIDAAQRADLDRLTSDNPRLIHLSITAYGDHPDHRHRPGIDALVMARTGMLYDQKGRRGTVMEYINGRPGPHPDFDAPDGMQRGTARPGPIMPRTTWPSVGAMYAASVAIAAALRARQVTGRGQRVRTSLLHGALLANGLNWQRVENPDAPLYWMWPLDSRAIEGLYECADGRWVHHWTVRPRWVLSAAEGDSLAEVSLDTAYRDDPDRLGMGGDDLLTGMILEPLLAEAFRKFPSAEWIAAAEKAGVGMALVRSPAEALADPSFLAAGCVVETDDAEFGPIRHVGRVLEFEGGAAAGETGPLAEHSGTLDHPLQGLRVIDLGLGVAGPFTGRILADLGADVIKVHALHDTFWTGTHMGLGTNRGKRSISLNLKEKRGREALERLIATADVVTTNWRPGAAARLGLDWDTLHARYPRLVWCNTRGFEHGPRSDLPGTDQTAAALTGTEWEDGACAAGNPPLWSRSNMGDTGNALLAAVAITAALYQRDRTGVGQAVGTSIVNAGLLHTSYAWLDAKGSSAAYGSMDADQYGLAHYRIYACAANSYVVVAALDDAARAALAATAGAPADDGQALATAFAQRSASEWFAALDAAGVPVEVVDEQFCRTIFDDDHARQRGLIVETSAYGVGRFEDPGAPFEFSQTPTVIQRGPCVCGEHTTELLTEAGFDGPAIEAMIAERAAYQGASE